MSLYFDALPRSVSMTAMRSPRCWARLGAVEVLPLPLGPMRAIRSLLWVFVAGLKRFIVRFLRGDAAAPASHCSMPRCHSVGALLWLPESAGTSWSSSRPCGSQPQAQGGFGLLWRADAGDAGRDAAGNRWCGP